VSVGSLQSSVDQLNHLQRHSKQECSEAERLIWNPAYTTENKRAGFQIAYCAALRARLE
jgi:hypothetical protein